ncbi:MAG: hypothetical protein RQ806_04170 [Erythrobacter sp.]|nr:hypothetical protein [Erythrobacter sp.]
MSSAGLFIRPLRRCRNVTGMAITRPRRRQTTKHLRNTACAARNGRMAISRGFITPKPKGKTMALAPTASMKAPTGYRADIVLMDAAA